jgi:hypothetical protein
VEGYLVSSAGTYLSSGYAPIDIAQRRGIRMLKRVCSSRFSGRRGPSVPEQGSTISIMRRAYTLAGGVGRRCIRVLPSSRYVRSNFSDGEI